MFDIKTLGYMRNLVNEQLRRQDCECLSEEKLQSLKYSLGNAIDGVYIRKLIKHIEDAMPGNMPNSTPEEAAAFDAAMDAFCAKKFTIGFDGMSITSVVTPELYDNVLGTLKDLYDGFYADTGMTYELRQKLTNVKFHLDFVYTHMDEAAQLDNVVDSQYKAQSIMHAIIDDLIALL